MVKKKPTLQGAETEKCRKRKRGETTRLQGGSVEWRGGWWWEFLPGCLFSRGYCGSRWTEAEREQNVHQYLLLRLPSLSPPRLGGLEGKQNSGHARSQYTCRFSNRQQGVTPSIREFTCKSCFDHICLDESGICECMCMYVCMYVSACLKLSKTSVFKGKRAHTKGESGGRGKKRESKNGFCWSSAKKEQ